MAAANYFEIVQNLYIAYYQRPADPAGLKYWPDQIEAKGGVASSIVNAFATSPESIALYGPINATNIGGVVDKIYLALFSRAPDAAGKQFYVDGFIAGTFTAGTIALDVLNGASNSDNTAILNKVQVANLFTAQVDGRDLTNPAFGTGTSFNATYSGNTDAQAARNILKAVTSDPTTVLSPAQVTEQIKTKIADPGDKILTPTGPPTTAFTVTVNSTTHTVSFDGTATGDITIAWAGAVGRSVATFTRDGLTGTANFPAATSIALSATDVLSTSAANIAALPISGAAGTVKLTDTSLAAASLNTLNAAIAGTLNAGAVTTITGSAADLATLVAAKTAGTITPAANFAATLTGTVSVAGANAIDAANGTGVLTATIIEGTIATLKTLTATGAANAYTLTVTDTSAAAADLIALDARTTVTVRAGAVATITGSVADIKTVATAAGITKAANWSAAPTDASVSVADANLLNAVNGTGVVTATITAGTVATLKKLTGTNNAYTLTITDATAAAADLLALDALTTVAVGAGAVTTITGSVAHIKTVAAAAGITKAANWSAAPTDVSVSVADANLLDAANGSGVITESITEGAVATLKTLTATGAVNAYTLTVKDTTAAAADLLALDALTTVAVRAGAVTTITGSVADIKTVATAAGITKATSWSAAPTDGSISVADANILDAANGNGVITETITEGDVATLRTLTGTNNAYTLTVTDTTAAAADLIALDARTTVTVRAGAVATITGSVAHIKTVAAATGITKAASWSAAPTDVSVSVADANLLDAANGSGVVTATITAGTVATLKTLTGTNNVYTLTVTSATAAAVDLLALDALTTVTVGADAVTTITGSAADIKTVAAAAGITKAASWSAAPTDVSVSVADANLLDAANGNGVVTATITAGTVATLNTLTGTNNAYTLTITDTAAAAADLIALNALTTVAVRAGAVTAITGSAADLATLVAAKTAGTITLAANFAATLTDTHTLAQLKAINNATSGAITVSDAAAALSGSATDVVAALTGIAGYTGAVTLSDAGSIAATVLSSIDNLTSGLVTAADVTTVTGSAAAIAALAAKVGSSGDKISLGAMAGEVSDAAITITGAATINQWNTMAASTSGAISGAIGDTMAAADGKNFTTGYTGNTGVTLTGSTGTQTVTGSAFADTLAGGAGADILTGGAGGDTFKYTATSEFGDTIMDFGTGDILHLSGVASFGGFFIQTGVTAGSNYSAGNVFIFSGGGGAAVDIATVAAEIANDASVIATAGLIILKEDTSNQVEVWFCADMKNNGSKQMIATLVGVDIETATFSLA